MGKLTIRLCLCTRSTQRIALGTVGVSFQRTDLAASRCPSCGNQGLTQFYHVSSLPVHSCLLMETRRKPGHPRGELKLAFCPACGVISNVAYDPADHHYSDRYEETQGFSPTFNAFARELSFRN